jgi:Zn-dependent protease with chaperone function
MGGLAAYSWPDGTVALSRGLVESLSADELAAAVAHELGHLINDGWVTTPASLTGSDKRLDEEARADATALRLLQSAGRSSSALGSALKKVISAGGVSESQRAAMRLRIERLEIQRR